MTLNLSIIELAVLFFCAVTLGIVIHFFITSRRSLKSSSPESEKNKQTVDEWKLKYFNEVERKEQETEEVKKLLDEAEDGIRIYKEEIEELRKQQKRMQSELESEQITVVVDEWKLKYFNEVESKEKEMEELRSLLLEAQERNELSKAEIEGLRKQQRLIQSELALTQKAGATGGKPNYIEQLRIAQASLVEHNEKINQLLENIEAAKESEEKQKLMEEENAGLMNQIKDLKYILSEKEIEIHNIRQKENLTKEMTSMLDSAYSEFNTLQSKMHKLESQLASNKMISLEYEDLKEEHIKVLHGYEDYKSKVQTMTAENQQLTFRLNEIEDKFREANFQRQQLQKRVSYLEELNNDLQVVADANKKLEHQLRRIGELESMLNVVSEENQFLKRQVNQ
jgi:chromosome segregation ATPase